MMWVIWVAIILVVLAFLKFEHYRKTWHVFLLILLIALLFFSMSAMLNKGEMDFSSPKATINSFVIYGKWMSETSVDLFNIGKDTVKTVGNVIRLNETETRN